MLGRRHLERGEHVLGLEPDALADLGDARRAAQLAGQLLGGGVDPQEVLLQPSWHPHRPGAVAEVAADLAHDGRRRERAELVPQRGIEALDGVDQAQEADLFDVLERLAAVGEPARDEVDEVGVQLDELVANVRVVVIAVLLQQATHQVAALARRRLGDRAGSLLSRRPVVTGHEAHEALYFVSRTRRPPVRSSTR